MPDFQRRLKKAGYVLGKQRWFQAWKIPTPKSTADVKQPSESEAREAEL